MQIKISSSTISGSLIAPPSKSYMQRAVVAAMLANGQSILLDPCNSDDSKNMISIAKKFGAEIIYHENEILINGGLTDKDSIVNVGESGFAMRMMLAVLSASSSVFTIVGKGSLPERDIDIDYSVLEDMGAKIRTNNGRLPVTVKGKIKGGEISIDASGTSQFLSGLLFTLPTLGQDSELLVKNHTSRPYIDLSIEILSRFGINIENQDYKKFSIKGNQAYKAQKIKIEKDWSSAAFMLVAAAITGELELEGLNLNSTQADRKILAVLKDVGTNIISTTDLIRIKRSGLNAFRFDATNCPDLFPPLVALAVNCKGKTVINGTERLINKESNRAKVLIEEFKKLGGKLKINGNKMTIYGGKLKAACVNSHGDHRIAMALAVAALNIENGETIIDNCECVSKSYPRFFEDLRKVSK